MSPSAPRSSLTPWACVGCFRSVILETYEMTISPLSSYRPAAQCHLLPTRIRSYTPDQNCGSVSAAAGANVAADAVATANCASRRPRVPTVSRTTAHSGSGRGVATRAPLYVHKRLSFLPTLMFCCYAASKGDINRLVLHLVSAQLRVLPLLMTLHAT